MVDFNFETITSKHALAGYAITAITVIEMYALSQGVNGALLSASVAVIAGLGGRLSKNNGEQE